MLSRKKVVLVKKEVTYGVDASPTGADNAILVSNPSITPLESLTQERDNVRAELGNNQVVVAGQMVRVSFDVELAGAGTAGNAPKWAPLLLVSGFSETLSPGVSATYVPVSASFDSATVHWFADGIKHALVGARASKLGFRLRAGEIPKLSIELMGLYATPTDVALPTATLTGFQQPLAVNKDNSSAFNLHSYSGKLHSLEIDMGLQTVYRNVVGAEEIMITDRKPSGNVAIDAVLVGTKDFWTPAKAATLGTLSLLHGTAAGNKVQFDAPKVQLDRLGYGDADGVMTMTAALRLLPDSGNDELSVVVK